MSGSDSKVCVIVVGLKPTCVVDPANVESTIQRLRYEEYTMKLSPRAITSVEVPVADAPASPPEATETASVQVGPHAVGECVYSQFCALRVKLMERGGSAVVARSAVELLTQPEREVLNEWFGKHGGVVEKKEESR